MAEKTEKQRSNSHLDPYKFKPGQCGNPGGRPSGTVSLTAALKRRLIERPDLADQLLDSYIEQALQGNSALAKEIWERVDGKVAQVNENHNINTELDGLSDADRIARLRNILSGGTAETPEDTS